MVQPRAAVLGGVLLALGVAALVEARLAEEHVAAGAQPAEGLGEELADLVVRQVHQQPVGEDQVARVGRPLHLGGVRAEELAVAEVAVRRGVGLDRGVDEVAGQDALGATAELAGEAADAGAHLDDVLALQRRQHVQHLRALSLVDLGRALVQHHRLDARLEVGGLLLPVLLHLVARRRGRAAVERGRLRHALLRRRRPGLGRCRELLPQRGHQRFERRLLGLELGHLLLRVEGALLHVRRHRRAS